MASVMPTGAVDTFTGSDGAGWNGTNWVTALNEGSGGGGTIQSNKGRLRTGTTAFQRSSMRLNGVSRQDTEVVFTFTVVTLNTMFAKVFQRANTAIDTGTGYYVDLDETDITLGKTVSYSSTDLVTYTHGFTAGAVVKIRFACFGTALKVKIWDSALPEPGSWHINTTDGAITAAGSIGITNSSGSAGAKDFFVDDFNALDTETATSTTFTGTGGVTPTGTLIKKVVKNAFTAGATPSGTAVKIVGKRPSGALTPSATFAQVRVIPRTWTGGLTPSATLVKSTVKSPFTASATPTGALTRKPYKTFAASMTPSATNVKSVTKNAFTAAVTPSGTATKRAIKNAFTASATPTGALTRKPYKVFAASMTPTATTVKKTIKNVFAAGATPTGALARSTLKRLTAAVTPSGALTRRPAKNLSGALTLTGLSKKTTRKTFTAAATSTASLVYLPAKVFTAAMTPIGTLVTENIGRIFGRPGIVVLAIERAAEVRMRIRRG